MPNELAKIALLDRLRNLRRGRRRWSASFITTYSINLPFYEDVVLRHLEAAGSRFNVVLADAGQLARALQAESTRPRRAGVDYLLLPIQSGGAFHPKIIALFSSEGMAVAIGSNNLTEAGFGRNGEICAMCGFDQDAAPVNVSRPIAEFLIQCAGELAPGDAKLSRRLADRLQSQAQRGVTADDDVTFVGARPIGSPLLQEAFRPDELTAARRVLVLGPYFDNDLRFLIELRKRAPRAEIVVAIQPDHAIIKQANRWPARTRVCNADALELRSPQPFVHAKAVIVDLGKNMVVALGSANPSGPAWLGKEKFRNAEAMIVLRKNVADQTIRMLGLTRLWDAPAISKEQLKQIERRSQDATDEDDTFASRVVVGLWKQGRIEAQLNARSGKIHSISRLTGATTTNLSLDGATINGGELRFVTPEPGVFAIEMAGQRAPTIVIASSAAVLAPSLVSGTAARLIDELGRLDGGAAPGDELIDLCERVLLEPDNEQSEAIPTRPARGLAADSPDKSDDEATGPRGISISEKHTRSDRTVGIDLDISAIITLLLKNLDAPTTDYVEPVPEDDDEPPETEPSDTDDGPTRSTRWEDIVDAIRPRIRRLLNRLSDRLDEDHSAKWKYERVLVTLALLKRLRKLHPGNVIPCSGLPTRLADDDQVRDAFKMAMRCWFARNVGVVATLERLGGVEREHEIIGRALLLWAAYESKVDAALPANFNVGTEELLALQSDRTDALVTAIAASASADTLERARRELFERGPWREPRDHPERLEAWFNRHAEIGKALQNWLMRTKPPSLPIMARTPTIQDIVVWKNEPGWPRLPQMISGRAIHLTDVGDADPLKIAQQFVQTVDIDALGLRAPLAQLLGRTKGKETRNISQFT